MIAILFFTFITILSLSEALHLAGCAVEVTRKLVHCSAAILLCFFPWLFSIDQAMGVASVFLVLFSVVESYGFLGSITDIRRRSLGGVAFVLGVAITALLVRNDAWLPFQISMIILAVSDTAAAVIGKGFQPTQNHDAKTRAGSLAFFLVTLTILLGAIQIYAPGLTVEKGVMSVIFSICLALVEFYSPYGLDNLFLPILSMMMVTVLL